MTSTSYCYGKYESSDDEDDHHINRVGVEEEDVEDGEDGDGKDDELIEVINHYMTPPASGFEVVSTGNQYRCNDWANSGRLINWWIRGWKKIRNKSECADAIKWCI